MRLDHEQSRQIESCILDIELHKEEILFRLVNEDQLSGMVTDQDAGKHYLVVTSTEEEAIHLSRRFFYCRGCGRSHMMPSPIAITTALAIARAKSAAGLIFLITGEVVPV